HWDAYARFLTRSIGRHLGRMRDVAARSDRGRCLSDPYRSIGGEGYLPPPSGLAGGRPVLPPFSLIVSSTTCVKRTHSSARRLGSVTHESTVTNVHAPVRAARGGSSGAMIRQSSSSILSRSCLPALEVLGQYVFVAVGVNVGYHRLVTHRRFVSPRPLERFSAHLCPCALEGVAEDRELCRSAPARALSRPSWHMLLGGVPDDLGPLAPPAPSHGRDKGRDPHSLLASFLWGHIGWLMIKCDNANARTLKTIRARS